MKQTILSILALFCCAITVQAQPSSFSLRNSHVTMPQGYNDFSLKNSGVTGSSNFGTYMDLGGGNWFKGYYVAIGIGSGTHRCTSCRKTGKCSSCSGKGTKIGILP